MYDLVKVGNKTFYMNGPYNIGIYKLNEKDVCLIDTGVRDHTVAKIDAILSSMGWEPVIIINTHYHADHAGGNHYFQKKYGSRILALKSAVALMNNFELGPAFVYGGFAPELLNNKYTTCANSIAEEISPEKLPEGLSFFRIDGHAPEMLGVRTDDDIYFLADGLVSELTLELHHISFIYDVKKYLESLDTMERLKGRLFIPAHVPPVENIKELVEKNRRNVLTNINLILDICKEPLMSDEVITRVFEHYDLKTGYYQYVINGTIIRSYLSYLVNDGRIEICEVGKKLCYRTVEY